MGANDDFIKIRVSDSIKKDFDELAKSKGNYTTLREAYDQAFQFFLDMNMAPNQCEPIAKQMQKETGRYISFFRMAEKNIYSRIDSALGSMNISSQSTSTNGDFSRELTNISQVLRELYMLIRIGYKLDLQALELLIDDEEVFSEVMNDFKSDLKKVEK